MPIGIAHNAYDLALRFAHAWDFSALALALEVGLGGGLSLFTQTFDTPGRAPDLHTLAPFLALAASAVLDTG